MEILEVPDDIRLLVKSSPFENVFDIWKLIEEEFGQLGKRWLCLNDRYYLLVRMYSRLDMVHPWLFERCREVESAPDGYLDLWSREHYKAIDCNEPVPTPFGWKSHGDLVPGDKVFGSDGSVISVVAKTEVFVDADCYQITFDDGYKIVCSGEHLWNVERKSKKRVPGAFSMGMEKRIYREDATLTTKELFDLKHEQDKRIAIRVFDAADLPDAELPIDPYVFGYWLGDGHSDSARITTHNDDIENIIRKIEGSGHNVSVIKSEGNVACLGIDRKDNRIGVKKTLGDKLRDMGMMRGRGKFIPEIYLRGSINQRIELLRGLMDSDGHINTRGTAYFVNINFDLSKYVFEIAASLGMKPSLREHKNKNGYVFFHVSFQAYKNFSPVCLPRKLERCKDGNRMARRFIVSVEKVDSIPVSCIQVSAKNGLYLVGKNWVTTHNSTVITYGGISQEILKNQELTCGIFSHTKPISKAFLKQIKTEFERNEELKECFPDVLYENPERDAPSWSLDAGIIVKRSSNPKEATIEAHGLVDGQPTSKHFGLLVYDDVVTRESVGTPEQIKKTTEAWELSDNLGAIGGRKWMVGTRYSYADSYEEIIKRGAVKPRVYPATHDGTMAGKPVLWPQEVWDQKKIAQGEATVCCQLLQNPLAGQQRMFDVTDICAYEIRPATLSVYIMVDPARSKKTDSDNTAIVVIGVDYNVNKYLLDGFNHKMDLQERWQNTSLMYKRWKKMPGVQSVKVGYESYGAQADLDYFKERQRAENLRFEIEELAWPNEGGGSKVDRVQRLGPDLRSHKIFLPYETDVNNYTSSQRNMVADGYTFRVAQPIKRKDTEGRIYNLSDDMKLQFHYFPFGGKKDLVDAFSRIYDMNPMAPSYNEPSYMEPDYV